MIRPYQESDFETVTQFWFDAMNAAMPGLNERLGHTLQDARDFFQKVIAAEGELWVYEMDGIAVGYLAMRRSFIDRLYVAPAYHRRGIGQALLEHAMSLSPRHLWLYTHAANMVARVFYEKNGFTAEKFGVSPPPESEPDVEYHWRGK